MVDEGGRASRVISQGRALFLVGLAFSRLQLARRCQMGLASPWQKSRADSNGQKNKTGRYGTAVHARYCTLQHIHRRAVGAGVATDWSCSFQPWCACSKKAGILPSTALIRL